MSAAHGEQVRALEEHGHDQARDLNWWGMVFFLASEALIFANFIAVYLYLEIRDSSYHVWSLQEKLGSNWYASLINTVVLLASSGAMHFAATAIRKGNRKGFLAWLGVTILMGIFFLGGQVFEYSELISKEHFTISSGTFGSAFFTLTGFHGIHVTIGVIFLLIIWIRGYRGDFTAKKHFAAEAGELYWHFVDIVWIFVFSIVYLVPLLRG